MGHVILVTQPAPPAQARHLHNALPALPVDISQGLLVLYVLQAAQLVQELQHVQAVFLAGLWLEQFAIQLVILHFSLQLLGASHIVIRLVQDNLLGQMGLAVRIVCILMHMDPMV